MRYCQAKSREVYELDMLKEQLKNRTPKKKREGRGRPSNYDENDKILLTSEHIAAIHTLVKFGRLKKEKGEPFYLAPDGSKTCMDILRDLVRWEYAETNNPGTCVGNFMFPRSEAEAFLNSTQPRPQ